MTDRARALAGLGAVLLAAYLALRLALLASVMTHVDDLGPLVDLMLHRGDGWPRRALNAWRQWSYAPLQYFLAEPLLRRVSSPAGLLFMGRLAAFLPWLAGWALLAWMLLKPKASGWAAWPLAEAVLPLAWVLLSWRGLIESSQAYPYGATLLVAAGLTWVCCGPVGERLSRGLDGGALLGAALAVAVALNYQSLFFGAAAWIVLALEALRRRERGAALPLGLAGLLFAAAGLLFYAAHLKAYAGIPRFPPWAAAGYPALGAAWSDAPAFLLQAWPAVLQNLSSIGPWGLGGALLGLLSLAAGLAGLAWAAQHQALEAPERRLLLLCGLLAVVWSAGALAGRFPLSPTRHTFILQAPLLLLLAAGLRHWRLPRGLAWALPALLLAAWAWQAPRLWQSVRNRVDLARVEAALDAHPDAALASAPGDYTWDGMLLLRRRPGLEGRVFREEFPDLMQGRPRRFAELLLISHRGPLGPAARAALAQGGFRELKALEAVAPTGSTELSGDLNGGNGFYLTLCRRRSAAVAGH
jgi:hypothetical protein